MLKSFARACSRVLVVACLSSLFTVHADVASGIRWLESTAQTDGSLVGPNATATPYQGTVEALHTFAAIGGASPAVIDRAFNFLNSDDYAGISYLAGKLAAQAALRSPDLSLAVALRARLDERSTFGEFSHYQTTPVDTAAALVALDAASAMSSQDITFTVGALLGWQRADGGWSLDGNDSDVLATATVVGTLARFRGRYNLDTELARGVAFLMARRTEDSWASTLETAAVVQATIPWVSDPNLLSTPIAHLVMTQGAGGDWDGDVLTTALAVRAIHRANARLGGTSGTTTRTAAIQGRVIDVRSGAPISSATITLPTQPGVTVSSGGDGRFLVPGLPVGDHTIVFSKAGFNSVSATVSLAPGVVVDVGDVGLGVKADTAIFKAQVFDSLSSDALPGAAIKLTGPATYTAITDSVGEATIAGIVPGTYAFEISLAGYSAAAGSAEFSAGVIGQLRQGLLATSVVPVDTPLRVTGRVVNGITGDPVSGASLKLGTGQLLASTDVNGLFSYSDIAPGDYALEIGADGFSATRFDTNLPAGSSGQLGDLKIYPVTEVVPPTALTLRGHVTHSVTGDSLSGVKVVLVETGESVLTDAGGNFAFAGITLNSFTLDMSATGFTPQSAMISVTAFGQASASFSMVPVPENPTLTTSVLSGVVTRLDTGVPISGAQVSIPALGLSMETDGAGAFQFDDIAELAFDVKVDSIGYQGRSYALTLAGHGQYNLPVKLAELPPSNTPKDPTVEPVFQVFDVTPEAPTTQIEQTLRVTASVANISTDAYEIQLLANVVDASGATVATLSPVAPGTETPAPNMTVAPGDTVSAEFVWHTGQAVPGRYRLVVYAVEPYSLSRALPTGVVYASDESAVVMDPGQGIKGFVAVDPPLAQAGLDQPVTFTATLANAGNVPLRDQPVELTVQREADGVILHSMPAVVPVIGLQGHVTLDLGQWVPSESGNLQVRVRAVGDVPGELSAVLYVGDKPSGQFTLASDVTPVGTHTIRARIDLQGVDVTEGSVADPLFGAVQQAVHDGGAYVAREGVAWQTRNRCLGCHIQTQSLYGLASSFDKAPIDRDAANTLYNSLSSTLQSDGLLANGRPDLGVTQTSLGAWSLTAWPDKREAYRTLYKAVGYLADQARLSGGTAYWNADHGSGWWRSREATTSLVLQSMAELIRASGDVSPAHTTDYRTESYGLSGYSGMRDIERGPDGRYYAATTGGEIVRIDPTTRAAEVWIRGIGAQALGLAFDDAGTAFVSTSNGRVYRIESDESPTLLVSGSGSFDDVEFGPDGLMYVSSASNRSIYQVDPASPTLTLWLRDNGLDQPRGLAFDLHGGLLVANYGLYNVLRIATDTKAVSVVADGLSYRPLYIAATGAGIAYYSSEARTVSGLDGPAALNLMSADGVVERLVSGSRLQGVLTDGPEVFFVDESAQRLNRLQSFELDRSDLVRIQSQVDAAGRYLLGRTGGSELLVRALILMGLGEVQSVTTDVALQASLQTAIDSHAQYLRRYQRPDGGWGRYAGWSSDAMVTALVGLALEYTDPSPQDPQVRAAILYLLGSQLSDHSWKSDSGILGTHLAATSLVMAYLPEALERLGGIDVGLRVDVPDNITLDNATRAPGSTTSPAGISTHSWELLGVTSSGRKLEFDLTFKDMTLNEVRPAALRAVVDFDNSFTGERLYLPLEIPRVKATSGVLLSVTTDKGVYGADEDALITTVLTNASALSVAGELQIGVYPKGGNTPVAVLPNLAVTPLAPNVSRTYTMTWNTGRTMAGPFDVRGVLVDSQDRQLADDNAYFDIVTPAVKLGASVRTDRPVYDAWDDVRIDGQVLNLALNAVQGAAVVTVTVNDPLGNPVHTAERNLASLMPLGRFPLQSIMSLSDASRGAYTVELRVLDRFSRALLTSANTAFSVQQQRSALAGQVVASPVEVPLGRNASCMSTLTNRSALAQPEQQVRQLLIEAANGAIVQTNGDTLNFEPHQTVNWASVFDTRGLALGEYLCVLQTNYQGAWQTLDVAGFRVVLSVEGAITADPYGGRLLVLMDAEPPAGGDGLEKPTNPPTLVDQRAHLEQVLTSAGWSYTIVTSDAELLAEIRSGGYATYALLSEREHLSEATTVALQESVRLGKGLFVAGVHDNRNAMLNGLLGLSFGGQLPKAVGVHVYESEQLMERLISLTSDRKRTALKLDTAVALGQFDQVGNKPKVATAVAMNEFGQGHVVTVGADLLAESTLAPAGGLADLLIDALAILQPEVSVYRPGDVVPLRVELTTLAPQVSGELRMQLPAGVRLVDQGSANVESDELVWSFDLTEGVSTSVSFWVRLPLETDTAQDFTARVFIDFSGALAEHTQLHFRVEPTPYPALTSLRDELQAAALADSSYQVPSDLVGSALVAYQQGDIASAIKQLSQAATYLAAQGTPQATALNVQVALVVERLGKQLWLAQPAVAGLHRYLSAMAA